MPSGPAPWPRSGSIIARTTSPNTRRTYATAPPTPRLAQRPNRSTTRALPPASGTSTRRPGRRRGVRRAGAVGGASPSRLRARKALNGSGCHAVALVNGPAEEASDLLRWSRSRIRARRCPAGSGGTRLPPSFPLRSTTSSHSRRAAPAQATPGPAQPPEPRPFANRTVGTGPGTPRHANGWKSVVHAVFSVCRSPSRLPSARLVPSSRHFPPDSWPVTTSRCRRMSGGRSYQRTVARPSTPWSAPLRALPRRCPADSQLEGQGLPVEYAEAVADR